jgi:hypothetical protein
MNAKQIITVLSEKYGFDADEALTYYESKVNTKDETASTAGSTGSRKPKRSPEQKLRDEIAELKAKIPEKKGKLLEKANAKLAELETKLNALVPPAPAPATPEPKAKKAEKAPPAPKKAEKPKKEDDARIKRMSPQAKDELKKAFADIGVEVKADEHANTFKTYINDMSDDDFRAHKLKDHMKNFAESKKPVAKEENVEVALLPVHDTAPATDFKGEEPEAIPDEDMTEVEFNAVKYVVGDITKRVYEADEEKGDRFVGFLGLGKFKDMKISA